MFQTINILIASAILSLLCPVALSQDKQPLKISGRVLLHDGSPAINVEVGRDWYMKDGQPYAKESVVTDSKGLFSGLSFRAPATAILAYSKDKKSSALAIVQKPSKETCLRLSKSAEISGKLLCSLLKEAPKNAYFSVRIPIPGKLPQTAIYQELGLDDEYKFTLPAGDYVYSIYAPGYEFKRGRGKFTTAPGQILKLQAIEMPLTKIAHYFGKQPPKISYTESKGLAKGFEYKNYQGKWLLIYFWAFT